MTQRSKRQRPTWYLHDETRVPLRTVIREAGGKSLLTVLACATCDVVLYEGRVKTIWDWITYKAAEDSALMHEEMDHEVHRSLPKRLL